MRVAAGTVIAVACVLAAGCGTRPAVSPGAAAAAAAPPPLATSVAGAGGAGWAIVEMGGSAAEENNFWQLFVRPAGTARWRLATPAGVADNGGLEATGTGGTGGSLVTGFRPSQDLTFSPLAVSSDDGASWSPAAPVSPGLADAPDALASGAGGRLLALTSGGRVELGTGTGTGTGWTSLSSTGALASTTAGRSCGLTSLTAAAFGSTGVPMLGAACSRPGIAGIFADHGGGWHAAGPALPAALAGQDIDVLRLAATSDGLVALLRARSGPDASLLAAWSGDGGRSWTLSAPLRVGKGQLRSTSVGPDRGIGVILTGGAADTLAGPGSSWQALPVLPAWTAALALGPGGQVDAIAAHAATFADWRLRPATARSGSTGSGSTGSGATGSGSTGSATAGWSLAQTVHVTIPYGSSG